MLHAFFFFMLSFAILRGDNTEQTAVIAMPESEQVMQLKQAVSLKQLAEVLARRLEDRDNFYSENFDDESTRHAVLEIINAEIATLEVILKHDAPNLYNKTMDTYHKPTRLLIWRGLAITALVGGTLAAACSYNPVTKQWEQPNIGNAQANFDAAYNAITSLCSSTP